MTRKCFYTLRIHSHCYVLWNHRHPGCFPNNLLGSEPVKVPERMPAPFNRDTDVRSYNDVHMQLNDKDTEDLIHGKDGLTDAEKRKRYLMELLAEKIKSKVAEAQKRGLKVPDKIMDFLWDYESRRSTVPETDKSHFSH